MSTNNAFNQILFQKNGKHDINPRTIYQFFAKYDRVNIPKYQRPYSWMKNNVNDLLKDIQNIYDRQTKGWFIGSIFTTFKDNPVADASNEVHILDGQQRLTTLQILLNELYLLRHTNLSHSENESLTEKLEMIKECLFKRTKPRFGAEENVINFWNKYISKSKKCQNLSEVNELDEELERESENLNQSGITTPIKIFENAKLIREYLHKEFVNSSEEYEEKQRKLISFMESTMDKLWLIETPLTDEQEVVNFFEGINNRGKGLTITDKLKYKSFTSQPEENWRVLTEKWKMIYSGLEFLETKNYIKDEDDFFKVFFNSLGKEDLTKDYQIIDSYEKRFLSNILLDFDDIDNFFNQVEKIIEFFKILEEDDPTRHFSNNQNESSLNITHALLRVFKSSLKISDNIRLLLFSGIRINIDGKISSDGNIYIIQQLIWKLIRFVLFVEINSDLSSNKVRSYYLRIIGDCQSNLQYLIGNNLFELNTSDDTDEDEVDENNIVLDTSNNLTLISSKLIKTKDNNVGSFIILLYCFLDNYEMLCNSAQRVKKYHLDHLFPINWWQHWEDKKYTRTDAIDSVDTLKEEKFMYYSKKELKDDIMRDDLKFELEKNKKRDTNRLIEYIGNKWVLDKKLNIASRNNKFLKKKEIYENDIHAKFPNNSNKAGINQYNDFSHKEIIERSLKIINVIHKKWQESIGSLT